MKRELKFRVYHDLKGMHPVYGFDKQHVFLDTYDSADYLENILPIEQCRLMQFTGLKDKNGKEIYEGDILRGNDRISPPVIFENGCFMWWDEPLGYSISGDYDAAVFIEPENTENWAEIIGNIHENPELL